MDGGYFGGYVKPANMKADRLDRRFTRNQRGKRKVVVIVRERDGRFGSSRIWNGEPSGSVHPVTDCEGHCRPC